jgi:hypothetical protein
VEWSDFSIYAVGDMPKYVLKLLLKYDGAL